MRVVRLSQRGDRESWLHIKRGLASGSRAKKLWPLSRGTDRTPAELWNLVAEFLSKAPEVEPPRERGERLEQEAVRKVSEITGLPFNDDPGMWISDFNDNVSVSPDAAEPVDLPTYAAEVKALNAGAHFKYLYKTLVATNVINPIDLVPNETKYQFREQCVQYFVVNEALKDLYFALYNEDAAFKQHELVLIHITRKDVEDLIPVQTDVLESMVALAHEIKAKLLEVVK